MAERGLLDDERNPDYNSNEYGVTLELRLGRHRWPDKSYWVGIRGFSSDNDLDESRDRYSLYLKVPVARQTHPK